MNSPTQSQFIEKINKLTKKVIENSETFHSYYIEENNNFYSKTLPLLMQPQSERYNTINTEKRIIHIKKFPIALKSLRHEQTRSSKIPELCPIFNNKGELIPSVVLNSKISKRDFNSFRNEEKKKLAYLPFKTKNFTFYQDNSLFNFNDFNNDFFTDDYLNLHYDNKEIFNHPEKYNKIIEEKIEYFKKNKNENETVYLEKSFFFGQKKKKILLNLKSLIINFEDPSEEKPPYNNININKNLQIELPFALLPLFYYKGIESFKKLLCSIIKFENNYQKVKIDEKILYNSLLKLKDYNKEIPKNNNNDSKEKVKIEKQNVDNSPFVKIDTIEEEMILKQQTFNLHPRFKNIKNFKKYNSYCFLWTTPSKNFKVTITLPLITFTVPSNSIRVQQFLDYELLFYIYNLNFIGWDFYIMKYLFGFKQFRFLIEKLTSHIPIFNIKLFLTEPKTHNYNFNEEQYRFIHTNENNISQILSLKSFYINVTIIDEENVCVNEYNIYFNFNHLVRIIQIEKFASKILFLIKFMDFNQDNTLSFNYLNLEKFDAVSWLKNVGKYNGNYFKKRLNVNKEKLIREFEITPTKRVKIEFKKPLVKISNFENFSELAINYILPKEISSLLPDNQNFLEWSVLLKNSLDKFNESNIFYPSTSSTKKYLHKLSISRKSISKIEKKTSIALSKGPFEN
jgi:hypothetical protein